MPVSDMLISPLLIRKIIMQLIFPPGGVIIAVLLILLLFLFSRKKLATCLTVFLVLFLFLFSSWYGETILLRPLEDDYLSWQEISGYNLNLSQPVMVVLGGGLVEESLSSKEGKTEIGEVTLARLYGAYLIWREIKCPVWVSGGSVPGSGRETASADIMEQVLLELGIPSGDIHKEGQSRTTFENAGLTLEEIRQHGYQEIILVTSALHMRRSVLSFENDEIIVIPAPVDYLFENIAPGLLNILPNGISYDNNLRALHEWIGLLYYRLFY